MIVTIKDSPFIAGLARGVAALADITIARCVAPCTWGVTLAAHGSHMYRIFMCDHGNGSSMAYDRFMEHAHHLSNYTKYQM